MKSNLYYLIVGLSLAGALIIGSLNLFAQKDHVEDIFSRVFTELHDIKHEVKSIKTIIIEMNRRVK